MHKMFVRVRDSHLQYKLKGARIRSGVFAMSEIIPSIIESPQQLLLLEEGIEVQQSKRNNQAAYTICTRKEYQTRGEIF